MLLGDKGDTVIKIDVKGTRGVLSGAINGNVLDVIREMPAYHRVYDGKLMFALVSSNIEVIKNGIPEAVWSDEAKVYLEDVEDLRAQEEETRQAKKQELPKEAFFFEFKTKPYDHQKKAFFISRDLPAFGWFMEMGTGKTKVAIDNAAHLYAKGEIDTMLIIAPNGVHKQWVSEQVPIHMPGWIHYRAASYVSTMGKKMREVIEDILADDNHLKIIAMNIEALSSKKGVDFCQRVLMSNRCMMVIDESSRIKNPTAKRTKAITRLGEMAPYRRIMSGSPVTKGVEDLYTQLKFLDQNILGFTSFYSFKGRYCQEVERMNPNGRPFKQIVGYKNVDELQARLDGHTFRVTKEECLDLPEKIYVTRQVEMTKEQASNYQQLKDHYLVQFRDGSLVTAALAVTRLMRLQRILCGHLENEHGELFRLDNNRQKVFLECVEEAQGKVIAWSRFKEDVKIMSEALDAAKIKYIIYAGGDEEALNEFKINPDVKVFISNPKSGGIGLNITEANTMIYYSNDFDAETRWQSEARAHRSGQTKNVTVIDLVCQGTIDDKITKALKHKKSVADLIVDGIEDILI